MKKLLSLVLVLALAFTCASFIASAESETIKLTWAMGTGSNAPADNAKVLEFLNAYSAEKIGVEVDIQYYTNDQLQLSIQSGEVHDIYFTCSWYNNTTDCLAAGLFVGLTQEEIEDIAPGLYNSMSQQVWDLATAADGKVYAIPNMKDYSPENFICYPADYAEELGYDIPDYIASWDELTDFLVDWKATYCAENEYPVYIGGAPAGVESSFDFISRTAFIGCTFGTSTVVSIFDDEEVMDRYRTMAKWMSLGLVNPDASMLTETSIDTTKRRINMVQAWDGYDYSVSNGYPTAMTRYAGPLLNVDGVQGSMNALSITLANDDAKLEGALKLLELSYTDRYYNNCQKYGIPGEHWYEVTEGTFAGCVVRTENGSKNYAPWAFSQPAMFNTSIEISEAQINGELTVAPNLDQYAMYYETVATSAKVSAMGSFVMDLSGWEDTVAQLSAIKEQYYASFATGTVSIDDVIDEYMEKANAAGLQELIDEAQEQLDAYLANN